MGEPTPQRSLEDSTDKSDHGEPPGVATRKNGVEKGVAPLTLLVSAGEVAAASKRPFLLSGSPCFVSTSVYSLNS